MVIGDDCSVAADEKTSAKNVELQMGSCTSGIELHPALVIDLRFAEGIDGDLNGLSGLFVEELHHDVQQEDAGNVVVKDGFGDFDLFLQTFQSLLRLLILHMDAD